MALADTVCVAGVVADEMWEATGTNQEGLGTTLRSLPLTHDAEEPGEGSAKHIKNRSEAPHLSPCLT